MVILDYNEVRSLERIQQALNASERLAGIVGTFQPGLPDIPFISLEELFSEQGPELVLSLLTPDLSSSERRLEMERSAIAYQRADHGEHHQPYFGAQPAANSERDRGCSELLNPTRSP
ncbi:putative NtrC family transcriptional regulators, ATPase domain [Escherichia coli]|uniref:Putative NtrC family transcriptional regulators, ATPase domain n=1 Tax=Escherichia coli TaxID=562 RepID=A0A376TSC1_ECOLX|nr:putative NtrC family transcriptional regulators, ATPase domain [Escherichia coli]